MSIIEPRFVLANETALIYGFLGTGISGEAFCKAFGLNSGVITEIQAKPNTNDLVARFNSDGKLTSVSSENTRCIIKIATCFK